MSRSRIFPGSDACVAPILALSEVADRPHNAARATFSRRDGVLEPAPAPRFSRTVPEMGSSLQKPGTDTAAVLADFGYTAGKVAALKASGIIGASVA